MGKQLELFDSVNKMYAYLNELSLDYPEDSKTDAWPMLGELSEISNILKNKYDIEQIKVPKTVKEKKVGNDYSINELLALPLEQVDLNKRQSLISFVANRLSFNHSEIDAEVVQELENKNAWAGVHYRAKECYLLTGAYLLARPVVSLATPTHCDDPLDCVYKLEYDTKVIEKNIQLVNIFNRANIAKNAAYLLGIKRSEQFKPQRWKPDEDPIWNKDTIRLLKELEFPQSVSGGKEKISELLEVGKLIAELNSWQYHQDLSKINSTNTRIREIFMSVGGSTTHYLSIDVKNPKGTFELLDRAGRHEGQISFETGKFIPREGDPKGRDDSGRHNIRMRR